MNGKMHVHCVCGGSESEYTSGRKDFILGLTAPPDPQLQGTMTIGHCMSYPRHNIHTSCDLQATDSGKNYIMFDGKTQGKMGGNHQKLRENLGKTMLKILYEPCIAIYKFTNQERLECKLFLVLYHKRELFHTSLPLQ